MAKKSGFLPIFKNGFGQLDFTQKCPIYAGLRAIVKSKWPKTHFYLLFKCDKKYKNIYKYEKKVGIWPIRLHIYFLGYFCLLSVKSKIFAKNRVWRIKVYEIL